jgi:hypothetical protein
MLFAVTTVAAAALTSEQRAPYVATAFSRLLANHADGHHIVLMEPRLCHFIETSPLFSQEDRATAKRIRNRHSDYGALPDCLECHAQVVADGLEPTRNGQNWLVPIRWIALHALSETNLVCEDLHDVAVVRAAAEDALAERRLRAFFVRVAGQPGGGANTHRVLHDVAVVRQKVVFCVIDSDRKFPGDAPGPTAQPCLDVRGSGLYSVQMTAGRAIENSIPWRLLDKVRPQRPRPPSTELADIDDKHPDTPWYLPFKKDVKGYDIAQFAGACRHFWEAASTAVSGPLTCCPAACTAPDQPQCSYQVHCGFGGGVLADVESWIQAETAPDRSSKYLPSQNDADWRAIGAKVGAYALGGPKRRI